MHLVVGFILLVLAVVFFKQLVGFFIVAGFVGAVFWFSPLAWYWDLIGLCLFFVGAGWLNNEYGSTSVVRKHFEREGMASFRDLKKSTNMSEEELGGILKQLVSEGVIDLEFVSNDGGGPVYKSKTAQVDSVELSLD